MDIEDGILYFWNDACSVCEPLYEKLSELINTEFPKLDIRKIDISHSPDLRAKYQVFTSPLIIFLLDGREYFRTSGNVSLYELSEKIERLYSLKFH